MKQLATFLGLAVFATLGVFALRQTASAQSIYENYTFTTFAGPSEWTSVSVDAVGAAARFNGPANIAQDTNGNVYIADRVNSTIRKMTPAGVVTTLAGLAGTSGTNDGLGAAARFSNPNGIAVDASGNVYVADSGNDTIREITPAGLVTTIAGLARVSGKVNATGSAARFNNPFGLTVSGTNLFVADTGNDAIRLVTTNGVVTTFAGTLGVTGSADKTGTAATFFSPTGIAVDSAGNFYVTDTGNDILRKISPTAVVSTLAGSATNGPGSSNGTNAATAQFNTPLGITVDPAGNVYVTDTGNDTIRQITPAGIVSTFAGTAGISGDVDATGGAARFNGPFGIIVDANTNLTMADFSNNSIRKVDPKAVVTTFAGLSGGVGTNDGTASQARFNEAAGAAVDTNGNVFVADEGNNTIREISTDGTVSTFAGTAGVFGSNDATGIAATFNRPVALAFDQNDNLYVADSDNSTIRMITPAGVVSTFAGTPGVFGDQDGVGTNAQFNQPLGLAVDGSNNVFVADTQNNIIRMITPGGVVSTLPGSFSDPEGIVVDSNENIFFANDGDFTIREMTPDGTETTLAGLSHVQGSSDGVGTNATFRFPFGLVMDTNHNLYVVDSVNELIRKITPAGAVTTLGGSPGIKGDVDATGDQARLDSPEGLAIDNSGNLYIADAGNDTIRLASPAPPDMPVVDITNADIGVARHFSVSNETTTSWSWTLIRQPSASSAQIIGANTDTPTFTPDVEDTYIIQFQGRDNSGHVAIRQFALQAHGNNRLAVQSKGGGTITPNLNGQHLQLGSVFVMTAKPVKGSTFSNWVAEIGTNAPFVFTNSPTISFAMQPDLTLIANFLDHENPKLTITPPRKGQFLSNAVFTFTGTASDNDRVVSVSYQLNGALPTNAVGTTNWAAQLVLTPGTNTVLAYAQDPSGNLSTNRASFIYVPSDQMTVKEIGLGTIAPNFNGWLLAIGTNYSMTAKAATGFIFSNWVDSAGNVITTNRTFAFTMLSNTAVTVVFSTNEMFRAQGNYAGLFYNSNNVTATNAGFFKATVTPTGGFTAKMLLAGNTVSTSGQFSPDGLYSNSVVANGFNTPFTLQLQLDLTGRGQITGTIGNSGWFDPLIANQDIYSAANPPSQQLQRFGLVIPGGTNDSSVEPAGNSFGGIILDNLGNVIFAGTLADGSPASQKTFLSRDGDWPFFISSSGGQGVTLGWLTFSPGQMGTLGGQVYWDRLPQAAGLYPGGFNFTNVEISASFYDFFISHPTLNLTTNGGVAVLQQAGLSPDITNSFTLNTKDVATGTNNLKLTISYTTGVFKGSIVNPVNNISIPVSGIVLTNQNAGFGFFINSNQSGAIFIGTNNPPGN